MQTKTIRRWSWIHKWTSLISMVFLLLLCITGLPLIFHHEIDDLLHAQVEPADVPAGTYVLHVEGRSSLDKEGNVTHDVPLVVREPTATPVVGASCLQRCAATTDELTWDGSSSPTNRGTSSKSSATSSPAR